MWKLTLVTLLFVTVNGVILTLNDTDYYRMPPMYQLDPYEACLHRAGGIYCFVSLNLVGDGNSELYDMIQNFSALTTTHFNHAQLDRGICLTGTCKHFYDQNTTEDQSLILERCLNKRFWEDYNLKIRIKNKVTCEKLTDSLEFESKDLAISILLALIVLLNLIGSLGSFWKRDSVGIVSCFSIHDNWKRLVAPMGEGNEPRLRRLRGISCFRSITIILIIMCHSFLPYFLNSDNPRYIEENINKFHFMVVANGTVIVQIFFMMSGFLLSYNLQLRSEKHELTWTVVPIFIVYRWIRLSCSYAIILAVSSTVLRYGSGPLWQSMIMRQAEDCQKYWWYHLVYINNYMDLNNCVPETWYIAADFQLFVLGLVVCVFFKSRVRSILLGVLFLAGVIISGAVTYCLDLDAYTILSPETIRHNFVPNLTFHHVYKRGHTNIPCFVMGLALGYAVLYWQNSDYKFPKFVRNKYVYWSIFPTGVGVIYMGSVFYGPNRAPLLLRSAYASLIRPIFMFLVCWLMTGMIFKFENLVRGAMEWQGWRVTARLSYSLYLVHLNIVRYLTGTMTNLVHINFMHLMATSLSVLVLSHLLALPLYVLIETPFQRMTKLLFYGRDKNQNRTEHNSNVISENDKVVTKV